MAVASTAFYQNTPNLVNFGGCHLFSTSSTAVGAVRWLVQFGGAFGSVALGREVRGRWRRDVGRAVPIDLAGLSDRQSGEKGGQARLSEVFPPAQ